MCSIMGYCSGDADFSLFKAGFDKTLSRGPDDSRIVDTGHGLLGFIGSLEMRTNTGGTARTALAL